nr:hypothetical protein [Gammaproteobacteria bacterium]
HVHPICPVGEQTVSVVRSSQARESGTEAVETLLSYKAACAGYTGVYIGAVPMPVTELIPGHFDQNLSLVD